MRVTQLQSKQISCCWRHIAGGNCGPQFSPQFFATFRNFCNFPQFPQFFGVYHNLNHGSVGYRNFQKGFEITICDSKFTICAFNIHISSKFVKVVPKYAKLYFLLGLALFGVVILCPFSCHCQGIQNFLSFNRNLPYPKPQFSANYPQFLQFPQFLGGFRPTAIPPLGIIAPFLSPFICSTVLHFFIWI